MKRLAIILAFLALPAHAQVQSMKEYLLQQPGDASATGLWKSKFAPTPGVDCPAGTKVSLWTVQNGDTYIGNYKIDVNGKAAYAPPPAPVPGPPQPDPLTAKKAILADPAISNATKVELMKFTSLIDDYAADPAGTKQAWALIKSVSTAIDKASAAQVEADCAAANMPLQ